MIKSFLRICAALGCCLLTSAAIQAQTNIYLVTPGGGIVATPHTTVTASDWAGASNLTAALAAANADSGTPQIWVRYGKYKPAVLSRDSSFVITKDGLKLYGGFAGYETAASQRDPVANPDTLSGDIGAPGLNTDNSYHVMIMYPLNGDITANTVIDGFAIVSGYADNGSYTFSHPQLPGHPIFQGYASGLLMNTNDDGTYYYNSSITYYGVSPVITRCAFNKHYSYPSGGGGAAIRLNSSYAVCSPSISACSFSSDTAFSGGAVYASFSANSLMPLGNMSITNSTFQYNNSFATGGGIDFTGSNYAPMQFTVKGCTFISNFGGSNGGGGIAINGTGVISTIDSSFFSNDTGRLGGAIVLTTTNTAPYNTGGYVYGNMISRCAFLYNKGYNTNSAGTGGAIWFQTNSISSINNCLFTGNVAYGTSSSTTAGGGALALAGGANVTVNNSTFYNDGAFATGVRQGSHEVVLHGAAGVLTLNNSILWNNFSDTTVVAAVAGGTINVNNSDVRRYYPYAFSGGISSDPNFTNPANVYGFDGVLGTADDGLTPYTGSVAIDAGSNALAPAGPDFAGNARIQNTTVDMGAYETSVPTAPYNALAFDGINDYIVSANNIGITGAQARTIEYWAKLSNVYAHQLDWGTTNTTGAVFGTYTDGAGHLQFYGWGAADFATGFVPDGAMHHVAVSYDGAYVRVYVDGTLTSAGAVARTLNTGNGHVFLGVREDLNSSTYSNTTLDEIRIWNRALCQAEIQNNKNGELPNPASQSDLVLYYKFDQGTASGYNAGITTATDASAGGNNGTLNNFALMGGNTSNFVTGTPAITGNAPQYAPVAPSSATESGSKAISGSTTIIGCGLIATVAPSGSSPVSGTVTGKVTEDASVQSYGGHAYVQRHYDITPASNAATATGTITLYYTQADFTAYNAANGTDPDLPATASSSDPNIPNLRITQYHGTGTMPGNYTGAAVQIIPSAVTYNTAAARWEVTFDVNGFSGFYATGNLGAPLPVRLVAFSAAPAGKAVNLSWKVAEQKDMARYTVERSVDGNSFSYLASQKAMDDITDYTAVDGAPYNGLSYYRLKMESLAGEVTYSSNQRVTMAGGSIYFQLSPVPVVSTLILETNDASLSGTTALISDLQGRTLMTVVLGSSRQLLSLDGLQPGIYFLRLTNGMSYRLVKQ